MRLRSVWKQPSAMDRPTLSGLYPTDLANPKVPFDYSEHRGIHDTVHEFLDGW